MGTRGYFGIRDQSALLEISVDDWFLKIRHIALVFFDAVHHPCRGNLDLPRRAGLPVVAMRKELEVHPDKISYAIPYIEMQQHISAAPGENFLEIDLGRMAQATHIIASGPVEFYLIGNMVFKEKDYGDDPWDAKRIAEADLLDFYVQPVSLCDLRVAGLSEE